LTHFGVYLALLKVGFSTINVGVLFWKSLGEERLKEHRNDKYLKNNILSKKIRRA
jgi:hypothetical protein